MLRTTKMTQTTLKKCRNTPKKPKWPNNPETSKITKNNPKISNLNLSVLNFLLTHLLLVQPFFRIPLALSFHFLFTAKKRLVQWCNLNIFEWWFFLFAKPSNGNFGYCCHTTFRLSKSFLWPKFCSRCNCCFANSVMACVMDKWLTSKLV